MKAIGIDIGTSKISVVAVDIKSGELTVYDAANSAAISSPNEWEKIQDAEKIYAITVGLLERAIQNNDIACIGITGQMHGIVYLDGVGTPASPLYTWQDGRGGLFAGQKTYAQMLNAATGFGSVTHYYNTVNNLIPEAATTFCTIQSYTAMRLTGASKPILHQSDAASLGLYDIKNKNFDKSAVKKAGMDCRYFPETTTQTVLMGKYKSISVSVAIGDNQASFLGSVREPDKTVLVNVGTGAQVSFMAGAGAAARAGLEVRPYLENANLMVGSSLCGGYAYSLWKKFIQKTLEALDVKFEGDIYQKLNLAAQSVFESGDDGLEISTKFKGTRGNPQECGFINGINEKNLTPQNFTLGILKGITGELFDMFEAQDKNDTGKFDTLAGSGNGIRRNPVLQRLLSNKFKMPLTISPHSEEAAYGAALFGMKAAGVKYEN